LARTAAALAVAVVLVVAVAHGTTTPESAAFIGTWTFEPSSSTTLKCDGVGPLSISLGGTRASIYPGTSSDLIFELGCHCRISLNLDGTNALIAGPQSCLIVNEAIPTVGQVQLLTLAPSGDGGLTFTLSGSDATLTLGGAGCPPGPFAGQGQLTRSDTAITTCGDDATAVGVVPYGPNGVARCRIGAGREGLQIQMHDEDNPPCSDETGSAGEGPWVLPDDNRDRQPACARKSARTLLNFCRVDGARFASMIAASDPSDFFAVLKLGERCPAGAVEVGKTLDNEDHPADTPSLVLGNPGPNSVAADPNVGTITALIFCYFRGAGVGTATMARFPDLGFPYAVFHRYADEQPPWVLAKHWQYSNDEDGPNSNNAYQGPDAAIIEEFKSVIENVQDNTYFNVARVR